MNIRMPNIDGKTTEERVNQMVAYLRQLVQDLNWIIGTLEKGQNNTSK